MRRNHRLKFPALLLTVLLCLSLTACGSGQGTVNGNPPEEMETATPDVDAGTEDAAVVENTETEDTKTADEISMEAPGEGPASRSAVVALEGVPMVTLNNGVQMPRLGLGTQIQSLERDASPEGRALLNETSRQSVVAALQAGYRHLDTAHGYNNETGVGQGIINSGVPREEIWLTSKLWPNEYGEGVTMEAIDAMLERLQTDYIDLLYLHHPAGDYEPIPKLTFMRPWCYNRR